MLLGELLNKFPLPLPPQYQAQQQQHQPQQQHQQIQPQNQQTAAATSTVTGGPTGGANGPQIKMEPIDTAGIEIKQEPIDQNNGPNSVSAPSDNGMDISADNIKVEMKTEMKPPPEKKMKI